MLVGALGLGNVSLVLADLNGGTGGLASVQKEKVIVSAIVLASGCCVCCRGSVELGEGY